MVQIARIKKGQKEKEGKERRHVCVYMLRLCILTFIDNIMSLAKKLCDTLCPSVLLSPSRGLSLSKNKKAVDFQNQKKK